MSLVWIPLFFLAGTAGAFPTNGVDEAQADVSTNATVQLWLVKPAAAAVDLVARPWQEAGSPSATIQLSSVQQPNAESESVDAITEPTVGSTVTDTALALTEDPKLRLELGFIEVFAVSTFVFDFIIHQLRHVHIMQRFGDVESFLHLIDLKLDQLVDQGAQQFRRFRRFYESVPATESTSVSSTNSPVLDVFDAIFPVLFFAPLWLLA